MKPMIINTKIETVPKDNWKKIMNVVIWGNPEGYSKYEPKKFEPKNQKEAEISELEVGETF